MLNGEQGGQVTGDVLCGRKAIKVFSDLQSIDDKYKAQSQCRVLFLPALFAIN